MVAVAVFAAVITRDRVADFVRERMRCEQIPGVAVAAIPPTGDPQIWSFGLADRERNLRFNSDTSFRIASLSKAMVAYLAVTYETIGLWSLEDSVREFVPELPSGWEAITLSHLVSHRSGIADPGEVFDHHKQYTESEFLDLITRLPLDSQPGTMFRYNNFGYAILQMAMERMKGEPLASQLQRSLFDPLAMRRSHAYVAGERPTNSAAAYHWRQDQFVPARPERPDVLLAAGGVVSTLRDLIRWEQALRQPRASMQEVYKRLFTPFGTDEYGYGGGWVISEHEGHREIQHTGETFGFTSAFLRVPSTGWTIIVLRNSDSGSALEWAREIHKILSSPFETLIPLGPHKLLSALHQ